MSSRGIKLRLRAKQGITKVQLTLNENVIELKESTTVNLSGTKGHSDLMVRALGEPGAAFKIVLPRSNGRSERQFKLPASGSLSGVIKIEVPGDSDDWPGPRFSGKCNELTGGINWPGTKRGVKIK